MKTKFTMYASISIFMLVATACQLGSGRASASVDATYRGHPEVVVGAVVEFALLNDAVGNRFTNATVSEVNWPWVKLSVEGGSAWVNFDNVTKFWMKSASAR